MSNTKSPERHAGAYQSSRENRPILVFKNERGKYSVCISGAVNFIATTFRVHNGNGCGCALFIAKRVNNYLSSNGF